MTSAVSHEPDKTKLVFAETLLGFLRDSASSPARVRAFETAAKLVEGEVDPAELNNPAAIRRVRKKLVRQVEEERRLLEADMGANLAATGAAYRGPVNRAKKKMGQQDQQPNNREFEKQHPRGRGGKWMEKGVGMGKEEQPDPRVKELQQRLTELGLKLDHDGRFGGITEQAVKTFQTQNGLEPTGKVDEITVETLRNPPPKSRATAEAEVKAMENPPKKGKTSKGKTKKGATTKGARTVVVEPGDDVVDSEGNVIRKGTGGHEGGRSAQTTTSGARTTGSNTTTGTVSGTSPSSSTSSSTSARTTGSSGLVRRGDGMTGDTDSSVEALQQQLADLGMELGDGGVDGRFGEDTEAAVKLLQRRYGLRVDGIVGPQTRSLIERLLRKRKENAKTPLTVDQEADRLKEADMEDEELVEASYRNVGPSPNFGTRVNYGGIAGTVPAQEASEGDDDELPTAGPRKGPVGWGEGEDIFGQRQAKQPPNLREATEGKFPRCSTCVHFNTSKLCALFSAGVDADDLCDSWLTLTPPEFQQLATSAAESFARIKEAADTRDKVRAEHQAEQARALVEAAVPTADPMYEHRVATLMSKGLTRDAAGSRAAQALSRQRIEQARRGVLGHQLTPDDLLAEAEELGSPLRYESAPWGYEDHPGAYWLDVEDELILEAAGSMAKATIHEPVGKPGGPGLWKHKGLQLPAYIQHIANDLREKRGMTTSRAIATAIAAVKKWAAGGGNVKPDTRAAAQKAVAEWEALKARHGGGKAKKLSEATFTAESREKLAKEGKAMAHGGYPIRNTTDLKNAIKAYGRAKNKAAAKRHIIKRAKALNATGMLPSGWLQEAVDTLFEIGPPPLELVEITPLSEAVLTAKKRKSLPKTAFAIPPDGYPIHDEAHARNALARSAGKPEEGRVRAAVKRRYPNISLKEALEVGLSEAAHPLSVSFDPQLHPRNRVGQFRDVLGAIQRASRGAEVNLPGGVSVKRRSGERLTLYKGGKKVRTGGSLDDIARQALTLSGSTPSDERPPMGIQTGRYRIAATTLDPGDDLARAKSAAWSHVYSDKPVPDDPQAVLLALNDRLLQTTGHGRRGRMIAARDALLAAQGKSPKLEGPFTYRSGWQGRYDPVEGRYLGMDDIYMPRGFDPETGQTYGGRSDKADPGSPQYTPEYAGMGMQHMQFENTVQPGDKVDVRWTSSNNAYAAQATVSKKNPSSVTVTLDHPVRSPYGGEDHYPAGRSIQVPLMLGKGKTRFSVNNGIFPLGNTPGLSAEKADPGGPPGSAVDAAGVLRTPSGARVMDKAARDLDAASAKYRADYNRGYRLSEKGEDVRAQRILDRANAEYEAAKAAHARARGTKADPGFDPDAPLNKPGIRPGVSYRDLQPEDIGPQFAGGRLTSETPTLPDPADEGAQLSAMTDREAVAYWNILQFPTLRVGDDGKHERHMGLMDQILTGRSIPHERGKRVGEKADPGTRLYSGIGGGIPGTGSYGEPQLDSIRAGDRVTIRTPQGQERSGRAVMKGPAGWVLNMGGRHGTPGIATEGNIVKVGKKKRLQEATFQELAAVIQKDAPERYRSSPALARLAETDSTAVSRCRLEVAEFLVESAQWTTVDGELLRAELRRRLEEVTTRDDAEHRLAEAREARKAARHDPAELARAHDRVKLQETLVAALSP